MRTKQRSKMHKGNLRVAATIDLDADDLAMFLAGLYINNGQSVDNIPADTGFIAETVTTAMPLYGMSVAAEPLPESDYTPEQHEALASYLTVALGMRTGRM